VVNLRIFPQTALLFLIDALRSTDLTYKLELYVDTNNIGGVLWQVDDLAQEGQLLFAENELQALMSKFMAKLQSESGTDAAVTNEGPTVVPSGPEATTAPEIP